MKKVVSVKVSQSLDIRVIKVIEIDKEKMLKSLEKQIPIIFMINNIRNRDKLKDCYFTLLSVFSLASYFRIHNSYKGCKLLEEEIIQKSCGCFEIKGDGKEYLFYPVRHTYTNNDFILVMIASIIALFLDIELQRNLINFILLCCDDQLNQIMKEVN